MAEPIVSVYQDGNTQAVRIPDEFRLESRWVRIERTPEGDLVLHPLSKGRGDALLETLEGFGADFIEALEEERKHSLPAQMREEL